MLQQINIEDEFKIDSKNIVFKAVPGSSSEFAMDTRCDETLICGTRGSMKTATQLNYFRQFVGIGYGAFWKGMIFDREFKNLTDLIAQSKKFFLPFGDCTISESTVGIKCRWHSGEELHYRHMKKVADYMQIHGHEYPFLGVNELTNQTSLELYDMVLTTNRSSFIPELDTPRDSKGDYATHDKKPLPPIPIRVLSTTNPSGRGHNAVKKRFIDPAPYGKIVYKDINIFNPQTGQQEVYRRSQIAIFSSYRENPFCPPSYAAKLASITDKNKRLAYEGGRWDITSGGALDGIWNKEIHIKPRFKIPDNWHLKRCFDWGSSAPFAVIWIAEATGETVKLENGKDFTPQRGSYIVFNEWVGVEDISSNKGIQLSSADIAEGILEREKTLLKLKWIETIPYPGAADNQIGQTRERDVETIKKKMEDKGVYWTDSDKSKGSRINGLELMRNMLESSVRGEGEGLYFMDHCLISIETIPSLPRDEDDPNDIDSESFDHPYDALRYGILEGSNRLAEKIDLQVHT